MAEEKILEFIDDGSIKTHHCANDYSFDQIRA